MWASGADDRNNNGTKKYDENKINTEGQLGDCMRACVLVTIDAPDKAMGSRAGKKLVFKNFPMLAPPGPHHTSPPVPQTRPAKQIVRHPGPRAHSQNNHGQNTASCWLDALDGV